MEHVGPPGSGDSIRSDAPPLSSAPPSPGRGVVLCLSGGGFRATFFHMGVLRYLCEVGELRRVTDIFAVSGGSILAAHLAQRWNEYRSKETFKAAADDLRAFADRDVRGRIVRTWLLAGTWFGLPLFCRSLRREQLLIREYERFFTQGGRSTRLRVLGPGGRETQERGAPDGPRVHLLTTSLTTGLLCEFSEDGFVRLDDRRHHTPVQSSRFSLPLAVAASSAFPPLFPPIGIDADAFGIARKDFELDIDHLSDGGVYDNLGISAAMKFFWNIGASGDAAILVSDASASFAWNTLSSFWNIVGRTARSSDVLMRRVAELELEGERVGLAGARLAVRSRRLELEQDLKREYPSGDESRLAESKRLKDASEIQLRQLSDYPLPELRIVRIDGSRDAELDLDRPQFIAFEGRWAPPFRRLAAPMRARSPWANVMASMRTDLDRFSAEEREFLEIWGYERASDVWSTPNRIPGSRPDAIGQPPTDAQLRQLQMSGQRRYRLVVPRELVGVALIITWCLPLIIGGLFWWRLPLNVLAKLFEWLRAFFL